MATPSSINVSGYTGTPGETITVTGANMQDQSITTLLSTWASNSNGAFLQTDSFSTVLAGSGSYVTDISVVNNNKSLAASWSGSSAAGVNNIVAEWYNATNYSRATGSKWRGAYMRSSTAGNWPTDYLKLMSEYGSSLGGCFLNLQGSGNPPGTFALMCTNYNLGSGSGSFQAVTIPGGWVDEQWNLVEWKLPCGGTDTMELYYNNRQLFSLSITGGGACNTNASGNAWPTYLSNAAGTSSGFSQSWRFDAPYDSSARIGPLSMIEITTGSDYASTSYAGNTRVYLPPISLSGTSSTAKLVLPSAGGPYYLWVTNQLGERSTGFDLAGGEAPPIVLRSSSRIALR